MKANWLVRSVTYGILLGINLFAAESTLRAQVPPMKYKLVPALSTNLIPVQTNGLDIVCGDFNGDGRLDFIGPSAVNNTIWNWFGFGDGLFSPPAIHTSSGLSLIGQCLAGDFRNTGHPDVMAVAFGFTGGAYNFLANSGTGITNTTFSSAFAGAAQGNTIFTRDMNGDGKLDLVGYVTNNLFIGLGDATGYFPTVTTNSVALGNPHAIALADFDADERMDVAMLINKTTVSSMLNNGDGSLTAASASVSLPFEAHSIVSGDFNNDGKNDVAVMDGSNIGTLGSTNGGVLLGTGDGNFQAPNGFSLPESPNYNGRSSVAGDFNLDGKLDLAIALQDMVTVLFGNGDGTFYSSTNIPAITPRTLIVADVNNDGRLDLIVGQTAPYGSNIKTLIVLNQTTSVSLPQISLSVNPVVEINGVAGNAYRIECTPDLMQTNTWLALTNIILPTASYQFVDPSPATFLKRLYRAVLLP